MNSIRKIITTPYDILLSLREEWYFWEGKNHIAQGGVVVVCIVLNAALFIASWKSLDMLCILFLVSLFNCVAMAFQRKRYQFINDESPSILSKSPNIILEPTAIPAREDEPAYTKNIPVLRAWNPSHLSLSLFKYFSPPQVLVLVVAGPGHPFHHMARYVLAATIAVTCRYIVGLYSDLQRDQEIVFGQVYQTYNQYALSRLSVMKYDKATMVNMLPLHVNMEPRHRAQYDTPTSSSSASSSSRRRDTFQQQYPDLTY
eukprot:TRINITY_DN7336_c0_g1_i5.p1 TRINITY_DN7336_c0_g1~~TRINITY_DN7336_c0_g1_i5.p1  ORF type:complete len:258 (-),score=56.28 TRINITY_DN7336_c0_g1_i5:55-828(-)